MFPRGCSAASPAAVGTPARAGRQQRRGLALRQLALKLSGRRRLDDAGNWGTSCVITSSKSLPITTDRRSAAFSDMPHRRAAPPTLRGALGRCSADVDGARAVEVGADLVGVEAAERFGLSLWLRVARRLLRPSAPQLLLHAAQTDADVVGLMHAAPDPVTKVWDRRTVTESGQR